MSKWKSVLGLIGRKAEVVPAAFPTSRRDDPDQDFMDLLATTQVEQKNFDWNHYQSTIEGGVGPAQQSEFQLSPNIRALKSMYSRESWVYICVSAISRPFQTTRFVIKRKMDSDGNTKLITDHPLLNLLSKPGSEPGCVFHPKAIMELALTGNAFFHLSLDKKSMLQLPTDRMQLRYENGVVVNYSLLPGGTYDGAVSPKGELKLSPDEVIHLKLPNPYSHTVGLSLLAAANLPVLIDRYGQEYVVSFFLRGGNMAGVIETTSNNIQQLVRLFKTIMQAFSSRRNMHADKILPAGTSWKGRGLTFSEAQFVDLMDKNARRIMGCLGVPPIEVGVTESVNYANAEAQMQNFWEKTLLPLQRLYCANLMCSPLAKAFGLTEQDELIIDNSEVRYLSDFKSKLLEDASLAPLLTMDERRQRLGFDPFPDGDPRGPKLASEVTAPAATGFGFAGLPAPKTEGVIEVTSLGLDEPATDRYGHFKTTEDALQDEPKTVSGLFQREFGAWEEIVVANLGAKESALKAIQLRAESFGKRFSDLSLPRVMDAYDNQLKRAKGSKALRMQKSVGGPIFVSKDTERERQEKLDLLRERAKQFMAGKIADDARKSFVGYEDQSGYSNTLMESVYKLIEDQLAAGASRDDAASSVRQKFGEFYEGQALTIVRTEFSSAIAAGQAKYAEDLGTVTKTMKKVWLSKVDAFTRDSHKAVDNAEIEGDPESIKSRLFSEIDSSYPALAYPKQAGGSSGEVINCRCTISWEPVEFL